MINGAILAKTTSESIIMSYGVSLDIVHGTAIFTSCLTSHVLFTRNLKTLKNNTDLILLVNDLAKKAWFNQAMQKRIENYVIEQFNQL